MSVLFSILNAVYNCYIFCRSLLSTKRLTASSFAFKASEGKHGSRLKACSSAFRTNSFFKILSTAKNTGNSIRVPHFLNRVPCALRLAPFIIFACALSLAPCAVANAATVTIGWDQNLESDIAGYKIHYGTVIGNYQYDVDVGNHTSCTISGLAEGTTYYFTATAYNTGNIESGFSEELAYTIPTLPSPPSSTDTDGDGILDNDELDIYGTDPDQADTDGDGINDGEELEYWGDEWGLDYDKDGLANLLDQDSDGDGRSDGYEIDNGSMPSDPSDSGSNNNDTIFYAEDFNAFAAGQNPVDWIDTESSNSMSENDSLFKTFDVGGDVGFGTTSTLPNIHSHCTIATYDAAAGFVYSGRMRMSASNSGIGVTFLSDYANSNTYYRLRRYNNNAFHLAPHGATATGDIDSGVVPAVNTWYWFKIQVQDTGSRTEIKARVWTDGTIEPAGWQIDAWDDSATRLTEGKIGVWSYSSGSKYWDDLAVKSISTSADAVDFVSNNTSAPSIYGITASASSGGSISPAGEVTVSAGSSATYAIQPNSGYHITDVKVDDNSMGALASYTFQNVSDDHTISANFEADVTASSSSGSRGWRWGWWRRH